MFPSKYINEVLIALIIVSGAAVIISAAMMASGIKELTIAYTTSNAVPTKVPLIVRQDVPYTQDQYKAVQQLVRVEGAVKAEAMPDKLVISSNNVGEEAQWRRVVSDALALDRNLHSARVCGSVANACSGAALVAELVGVRQVFSIKE